MYARLVFPAHDAFHKHIAVKWEKKEKKKKGGGRQEAPSLVALPTCNRHQDHISYSISPPKRKRKEKGGKGEKRTACRRQTFVLWHVVSPGICFDFLVRGKKRGEEKRKDRDRPGKPSYSSVLAICSFVLAYEGKKKRDGEDWVHLVARTSTG